MKKKKTKHIVPLFFFKLLIYKKKTPLNSHYTNKLSGQLLNYTVQSVEKLVSKKIATNLFSTSVILHHVIALEWTVIREKSTHTMG